MLSDYESSSEDEGDGGNIKTSSHKDSSNIREISSHENSRNSLEISSSHENNCHENNCHENSSHEISSHENSSLKNSSNSLKNSSSHENSGKTPESRHLPNNSHKIDLVNVLELKTRPQTRHTSRPHENKLTLNPEIEHSTKRKRTNDDHESHKSQSSQENNPKPKWAQDIPQDIVSVNINEIYNEHQTNTNNSRDIPTVSRPHAVAPGKHQMSTLISMATLQSEQYEEEFTRARQSKSTSRNRYGF